jgi:hypothetical protein
MGVEEEEREREREEFQLTSDLKSVSRYNALIVVVS